MKKIFYFIAFICVAIATSCSKDKKTTVTPTVPVVTGSTLDLIKDSVYLYTNEDYLWYAAIPNYATFNPRSYTGTSDQDALTKEVNALSQFGINPSTGKAYEYDASDPGRAKYSFIDAGQVSKELSGQLGDFGFGASYNDINDLRVIYVYPGSPADIAGLKRGDQITSINGNTSVSYDAPPYGDKSSKNYNFVNNAIYRSATISLGLTKTNGTTQTVNNLSTTNYTTNPVLTYKVFDQGNGHKVGYFVFNQFTSDANADPQLATAFNYFTAQGVTDLVVDLRYNGGGYVSTAEHIDNLIVPAAKSGTLMYTSYYNDKLQADKDPLLSSIYNIPKGSFLPANNTVNFTKSGSLNVNRVFFIVTGNTASASELTINNLRPEMDVQFIGTQSYGKPVGFFAININKYQLYTPEFSTVNSASQGNYYDGFKPGDAGYPGVKDYDDYTKDFGDPTEKLLAHALNFVKTGLYSVTNKTTVGGPLIKTLAVMDQSAITFKMNQHRFSGMIFNKTLKLKK